MNFLVDAQLPAVWAINSLSIREGFVAITKDANFVNSFLLYRKPHKLLLISIGNVRNAELEVLGLAFTCNRIYPCTLRRGSWR